MSSRRGAALPSLPQPRTPPAHHLADHPTRSLRGRRLAGMGSHAACRARRLSVLRSYRAPAIAYLSLRCAALRYAASLPLATPALVPGAGYIWVSWRWRGGEARRARVGSGCVPTSIPTC
ncbi:hypothetical protein BC567DRAFT_54166 [Phyllosticta citribraziliensis]